MIPEPYRLFMDLYGFDALRVVPELWGGHPVYFPTMRTIFTRCIDAAFVEGFREGGDAGALARRFGIGKRRRRALDVKTLA